MASHPGAGYSKETYNGYPRAYDSGYEGAYDYDGYDTYDGYEGYEGYGSGQSLELRHGLIPLMLNRSKTKPLFSGVTQEEKVNNWLYSRKVITDIAEEYTDHPEKNPSHGYENGAFKHTAVNISWPGRWAAHRRRIP